ncbi:MAG: O-antigen ligase family protein, partial [Bdellovibrionales bacterium]|nr:O-antigen ligase family protein [Bdellovibrionales bacterium]NQZ18870.1 O-antigen ligase family protein [Bdellovibrionales bacterium]
MMVASTLFLVGFVQASSRKASGVRTLLVSAGVVGCLLYVTIPQFMEASIESREENEAAIERSLSLFDVETVSTARRGAWDRFVLYAQQVPFGAGLSRVGAAAGAFKELHKRDRTFGYKYFFTDNFWLTALVEIGLPGMFIVTLLVGLILWAGIRSHFGIEKHSLKVLNLSLLSSLLALFICLYGAEGLIYNPEACFFWFFAGVMMKLPELDVV